MPEQDKIATIAPLICSYAMLRTTVAAGMERDFNSIIPQAALTVGHNDDAIWAAMQALPAEMQQWHNAMTEDKRQHGIDGHLFNVFSLWDRFSGINEPTHSRLLHFLLSNDELHGQGNSFLLEFLKLIDVESPEEGEWTVTAERGRVDVMLRRDSPFSVVIIENKSNWAVDQANQLYRYWYRNIHRCAEDCLTQYYSANRRHRIIYLSPNEYKTYSEQSCTKPARSFFDSAEEFYSLPDRIPLCPVLWTFNSQYQLWLEKCIELLDAANHPMREYIRQYKEYCKTL